MKISEKTLQILKNYATINQGIVVDVGNILKTVATTKTTYSECMVEEKFEKPFSIYDLNDFLSILSNFEDPEITFYDSYLKIYSDNTKGTGKYFYGSKDIIEHPETTPKVPDKEFNLKINKDDLSNVLKMSNVFQLDELVLTYDGKKVEIGAVNSSNPVSNSYFLVLSESNESNLKPFDIYFRKDTLKILPSDYDIIISQKMVSGLRIATFKSDVDNIIYHVAIEDHSKFGI